MLFTKLQSDAKKNMKEQMAMEKEKHELLLSQIKTCNILPISKNK